MTWVRVQTEHGVRYAAPSYSHPPALEGFDKLFDGPQRIRMLRCVTATTDTSSSLSRGVYKPYFTSLAPARDATHRQHHDADALASLREEDVVMGGDEVLVLLTRAQIAGARMGEVSIVVGVCGGSCSDATLPSLSRRLVTLMQCVLVALRCCDQQSGKNGSTRHAVGAMLDALCTLPPLTLTAQTRGVLSEKDGLPLTDSDRAIFAATTMTDGGERDRFFCGSDGMGVPRVNDNFLQQVIMRHRTGNDRHNDAMCNISDYAEENDALLDGLAYRGYRVEDSIPINRDVIVTKKEAATGGFSASTPSHLLSPAASRISTIGKDRVPVHSLVTPVSALRRGVYLYFILHDVVPVSLLSCRLTCMSREVAHPTPGRSQSQPHYTGHGSTVVCRSLAASNVHQQDASHTPLAAIDRGRGHSSHILSSNRPSLAALLLPRSSSRGSRNDSDNAAYSMQADLLLDRSPTASYRQRAASSASTSRRGASRDGGSTPQKQTQKPVRDVRCLSRLRQNDRRRRKARNQHTAAYWNHMAHDAELCGSAVLQLIQYTLETVFPTVPLHRLSTDLWCAAKGNALVAAYTPSGLLLASANYYYQVTHQERLLISALAMDGMLMSSEEVTQYSGNRALMRAVTLPFALSNSLHTASAAAAESELLVWTIGDALSILVSLPPAADASGAATLTMAPLVTYVQQLCDGQDVLGVNEDNVNQGSRNNKDANRSSAIRINRNARNNGSRTHADDIPNDTKGANENAAAVHESYARNEDAYDRRGDAAAAADSPTLLLLRTLKNIVTHTTLPNDDTFYDALARFTAMHDGIESYQDGVESQTSKVDDRRGTKGHANCILIDTSNSNKKDRSDAVYRAEPDSMAPTASPASERVSDGHSYPREPSSLTTTRDTHASDEASFAMQTATTDIRNNDNYNNANLFAVPSSRQANKNQKKKLSLLKFFACVPFTSRWKKKGMHTNDAPCADTTTTALQQSNMHHTQDESTQYDRWRRAGVAVAASGVDVNRSTNTSLHPPRTGVLLAASAESLDLAMLRLQWYFVAALVTRTELQAFCHLRRQQQDHLTPAVHSLFWLQRRTPSRSSIAAATSPAAEPQYAIAYFRHTLQQHKQVVRRGNGNSPRGWANSPGVQLSTRGGHWVHMHDATVPMSCMTNQYIHALGPLRRRKTRLNSGSNREGGEDSGDAANMSGGLTEMLFGESIRENDCIDVNADDIVCDEHGSTNTKQHGNHGTHSSSSTRKNARHANDSMHASAGLMVWHTQVSVLPAILAERWALCRPLDAHTRGVPRLSDTTHGVPHRDVDSDSKSEQGEDDEYANHVELSSEPLLTSLYRLYVHRTRIKDAVKPSTAQDKAIVVAAKQAKETRRQAAGAAVGDTFIEAVITIVGDGLEWHEELMEALRSGNLDKLAKQREDYSHAGDGTMCPADLKEELILCEDAALGIIDSLIENS